MVLEHFQFQDGFGRFSEQFQSCLLVVLWPSVLEQFQSNFSFRAVITVSVQLESNFGAISLPRWSWSSFRASSEQFCRWFDYFWFFCLIGKAASQILRAFPIELFFFFELVNSEHLREDSKALPVQFTSKPQPIFRAFQGQYQSSPDSSRDKISVQLQSSTT